MLTSSMSCLRWPDPFEEMKEVKKTEEQNDQPEAISSTHLQRLLEISTTLSSTLDIKQLLDMVIDTATELTNTEFASILLVDRRTGKLHFAAATGTGLLRRQVPLEGSAAGWIVSNGQPLILEDVERDAVHYGEVHDAMIDVTRDMLGVPLATKGRVIGVLEAINKRDNESYSKQDVVLLKALASQAAVAIENARLFLQTDLIAEFMHELKTPLTALTAATEILGRESLSDKQREILEMILKETSRLSKMTQDFLDLARLESGRTHIARVPVDIAVLVRDVVRLEEPQATARNINIEVNIPDYLLTISGDYDRLKQVLVNLTSNAIKYNVDYGIVTIDVTPLERELAISIGDTGPGIAVENIPHLFERFYRVPDSEGFSQGTGLGLSIASRIIQEHGGRIEVTSEVGKGSTFCLYLPMPGA
jgi:signal transduction histidine kinase